MQLKRDTSSAKTEEITSSKSSSQNKQSKTRLEIMQQFKTLLHYISWILKRTTMSQRISLKPNYSTKLALLCQPLLNQYFYTFLLYFSNAITTFCSHVKNIFIKQFLEHFRITLQKHPPTPRPPRPKKKNRIHLLNIAGEPLLLLLLLLLFLQLNIKYLKSLGSKPTVYFRHITKKHNC